MFLKLQNSYIPFKYSYNTDFAFPNFIHLIFHLFNNSLKIIHLINLQSTSTVC